MLMIILLIVLIFAIAGSAPYWPHSYGWGYYPSGVFVVLLIILIVLLLTGRL